MSTSLAATNWTALYVTNNPAANSFLLTDPQATNAARYYLVLVGRDSCDRSRQATIVPDLTLAFAPLLIAGHFFSRHAFHLTVGFSSSNLFA